MDSVQTEAREDSRGRKDRTDSTRKGVKVSSPNRSVSKYLAEIGRKGGQAKVPKGAAALSAEERKALGQRGARARWGKKKKAGK